jgi:hypothetical protein
MAGAGGVVSMRQALAIFHRIGAPEAAGVSAELDTPPSSADPVCGCAQAGEAGRGAGAAPAGNQ